MVNGFCLQNKAVFCSESTIPDGWSVGQPVDGEADNRTSTAQLGLGLGLSLTTENPKKKLFKLNPKPKKGSEITPQKQKFKMSENKTSYG